MAEQSSGLDKIIAGASGYILKTAPLETIIDAVRATAAGESVLSSQIAGKLLARLRELDIPVEEGQFTISGLKSADAAFFCGTAAEVIGWASIDDKTFSTPWASTLGRKVQLAYKDRVIEKQHHLETI